MNHEVNIHNQKGYFSVVGTRGYEEVLGRFPFSFDEFMAFSILNRWTWMNGWILIKVEIDLGRKRMRLILWMKKNKIPIKYKNMDVLDWKFKIFKRWNFISGDSNEI